MRIRVLATVALILGILLFASVALAAGYPEIGVGVGNTETWVMNVHESLDANVVATYVDQDGFQTGTIQSTIDPLGHDSFPAFSSELESGWLGSTTIDSLRPIASIAESIFTDVPGGDHWSASAVCDTSEGAQEIFFPGVVKTGCWRSFLTVQCLDTEDCEVFMTYRDINGNLVSGSPFLDTIESFSQETYDVWDASVNPNIPNDTQMPANWWGSVQVTSTQPIAGVARAHCCLGYSSAYNAVPATSATEIFFPGFVRRKWGEWVGQSDWSTVTVHNPGESTITAYLNLYNSAGQQVLRIGEELDAHESYSFEARQDPRFGSLPTPFLGSAVVTSTQPIVGISSFVRVPYGRLAAAHYGFSRGYSKLVFPVAYRVKDGDVWRQWTGINIQNVDPESEIIVYVYWIDADGTTRDPITSTVKPYASGGYSTKTDADPYGEFGPDWKGTVVVTTTSPLGIAGVLGNFSIMSDYAYIYHYNSIPIE